MSIKSNYSLSQFSLVVLSSLLLSGCAASPKYAWNNYDSTLYTYYKNPAEKEKYMERLKTTILKAEKVKKVPPGIYAEYGYMCYENKAFSDAVTYFKKEYDLWPESRILMQKMIDNSNKALAAMPSKDAAK